MSHANDPDIMSRLRRAEGHLAAVLRMVAEGRDGLLIAQQLQAVIRALEKSKRAIIHDHIDHHLGEIAGPLTPELAVGMTGAAYGLRQSLDTVGAFAGPLLAMALMALFANDFRLVFWLAVVAGLIAVAILIFGVREPERPMAEPSERTPIRRTELYGLGGMFWGVVATDTVLMLARFSEAFLILRAESAGLSLAFVPLVLVVMNIVYAASAYPVGILSDRVNRHVILVTGFLVLIAANVVLAAAPNLGFVMLGVGLWGLHMGMTQGLLAALVAEATAPAFRGTAFGVFHLVTRIATLLASLIAGFLWDAISPSATFIGGAAFTAVGLLSMLLLLCARSAEPAL